MHCTAVKYLAALSVFLWALANTQVQAGNGKTARKGSPPELVALTWKKTGYGETAAEAEESARAKAEGEACDRFHRLLYPDTEEFIKTHLIVASRVETKITVNEIPRKIEESQVTLELALSASAQRELLEKEEHYRQEQLHEDRLIRSARRQELLLRIFVILVVLLGMVGAYHRINDLARSRYNRWIRVGGVGIVSLLAIGMWLFT